MLPDYDYMAGVLVGYVKAGVIGWIVWFVVSILYVVCSFKLNLALYRMDNEEDEKGGRKSIFKEILQIVIWPWGILSGANEVARYVAMRLSGGD